MDSDTGWTYLASAEIQLTLVLLKQFCVIHLLRWVHDTLFLNEKICLKKPLLEKRLPIPG